MAKVGPSRSKSSPWRWAAAIAFSTLVNSLVVGFFWELRLKPVYDLAPPIVVQFMPPLTMQRLRSEAPRRHPARSPPLAVRPSSIPTNGPNGPPLPLAPSVPTVKAPDGTDLRNLSRTLRGALGCNLANLTDAERAACGAKLAANRPLIPTPVNLDPHGRYASNPEPYLTRMPKNGCKVRAAGDVTVFGKEGVAAGASCAHSF